MPIIQISEIRHRRGLKQDLPELEEGEIALTVDTGEMFIGTPSLPSIDRDLIAFIWEPNTQYDVGHYVANIGKLYRCNTPHLSSATFNGAFWDEIDRNNYANPNTKILTEWSKNVENILKYSYLNRNERLNSDKEDNFSVHEISEFYNNLPDVWPYQAVRRVGNASYDEIGVRRYLQERLDERVSVQSYGATGTGRQYLTDIDDRTINDMDAEANAIRRATIELANTLKDDVSDGDIYEHNKALHFPAGTYVVNKQLFLTNRTSWIGDGKGKTRIIFNIDGLDLDDRNNALLMTIGTTEISGNDVHIQTEDVIDETIVSQHTYQNISTLVSDIFVSGITFEIIGTPSSGSTVQSADIIRLLRAANVVFYDCEFVGNWDTSNFHPNFYTYNSDSQVFAIDSIGDSQTMGSSPLICKNIIFDTCDFTGFYYISNMSDAMSGVSIVNCSANKIYKGLMIAEPAFGSSSWATFPDDDALRNGPRNIKLFTNNFNNIASYAVRVYRGYRGDGLSERPSVSYSDYITNERQNGTIPFEQVSGVILSGNRYENVGNYHNDILNTTVNYVEDPKVPVVMFNSGATYNMSMGETFTRDIAVTDLNKNTVARVWYDENDPNVILNPQDIAFFKTETEFQQVTINPTTGFGPTIPNFIIDTLDSSSTVHSWRVHYTIVYDNYGTTPLRRRRFGHMDIIVEPEDLSISYTDDYTQINNPDDITLRAVLSGSDVEIEVDFNNTMPSTTSAIVYYKIERYLSPYAT